MKYKWLFTTLDCGDNSCYYRDRTKPSGMRTNGGCSCFKDLPQSKRIFVNKMWWFIGEQAKRIEELETEKEKIRAGAKSWLDDKTLLLTEWQEFCDIVIDVGPYRCEELEK